MPKPSIASSEAAGNVLSVALARGRGELEKWRGGYWTYPDCEVVSHMGKIAVPAWHAPAITVHALVRNGFAYYVAEDGSPSEHVSRRIRLQGHKRRPGAWLNGGR